jgi:fimbrial chaperone protein
LFVYEASRDDARPMLNSRIVIEQGQRWLVIRNSGTGHARLTDLTIERNGAVDPIQAGLVGYVLPGATMRWPLSDTLAPASVLRAGVNGQPVVLAPAV